ncbi:batten's disease protein Cln3 [Imleria badia]|nr:batten's disease protein Cln3 [Imleria badia]
MFDPVLIDHITGWKKKLLKLGVSFFLFGLINNVLYVIILSAALDLVPPSTPKGIIAFCNIFPALLAKLGWPYFLKGKIRYTRRIMGCAVLSFIGMLVVALYESLFARLLGISIASFSSGLGELTFLQLSTTYNLSMGGHSVGYFASGTGAAGLVGALLWWEVRGLGVRLGVGVSAVLPFVLPLTWFFLLPRPAAFMDSPPPGSYAPLPEEDPETPAVEVAEGDTLLGQPPKVPVFLTAGDKWRLVKPMIFKYMLPLFLVYTFEYTINQGVAPTLLYPVPTPERGGLLSKIIHSIRDYYPLWQLVYQSTVFISRSSISLGIPPLPEKLLSLPAVAQFLILVTLMYESAVGIFSEDHPASSIIFVFLLISIEGICGGLAYVNVFYRINQERPDPSTVIDMERSRQELEFKIGSLGFSDSSGILLAALLAVPTEVQLCRAQVARMKMLCKGL